MGIEEMLLNTQMLREIRLLVNLFSYKECFNNALTNTLDLLSISLVGYFIVGPLGL